MSPRKRKRQTILAGILLAAFASRALIPAGFMPSADRPFSLELCWDGLPAAHSTDMGSMPGHSMALDGSHGAIGSAHHHHPKAAPHNEHCLFGGGCSAGAVSQPPLANDCSITRRLEVVEFASVARAVHLVHLPQPRAPPGRLR